MFKPILAIVLPCYNEEAVLQTTALRIGNLLDEMIQAEQIASDSFACFVDDGSSDQTWSVIRDLAVSDPIRFRYVKLSRNYGHQQAILSGMKAVTEHCDCCVTIDADLQDDLGTLREMVGKFQAGQAEIVLGIKRSRTADSFFKRWTAKAFYHILDLFGCKSIENHADFRLLSRKALRFLSEYQESNLFLRGIIQLLGLKTEYVYYDIVDRSAGTTKYTLSKMCNLALIGITSFSVIPLRFLFGIGLIFFLLSSVMIGWFIVDYWLGNTVPGWATLAASIWALGGIQLMGLGILGEYLGQIFIEVKQRPRYLIEEQTAHLAQPSFRIQGKISRNSKKRLKRKISA